MAVMRGGRKRGAAIGAQPIRSMSHPFGTSLQVDLKAMIQAKSLFESYIAILNILWYNSS